MDTIVLYGTTLSGHTQRVAALLTMLGLPWRLEQAPVEVRRTPEFLALNPFGQIPVLKDGDLVLADSNAILVYLARRYDRQDRWLPRDPIGEAHVQRWLSVAAGEIAFGPARARAAKVFGRPGIDRAAAIELAHKVLALLDAHLDGRSFVAATHPTIADLALFPYVFAAPEGDVSLGDHANVRAWLTRVAALPGFVPLPPAA
jgi:glutathione S-transferase